MATNNAANNKTAASGKVMQGQGVGTASDFSTATYPSTATGTGKILRADGTNWVATTATFPDTAGTSGNVLTSDGTNWVSSNARSQLITITGQLTSLQIKALNGTPIEIIAAPGTGKAIMVITYAASFVYGGSNVFVAGAAQQLQLDYSTTLGLATPVSNATLVGTTSKVNLGIPLTVLNTRVAIENLAVNWFQPVATEITGNAANDNVVNWSVTYIVLTI